MGDFEAGLQLALGEDVGTTIAETFRFYEEASPDVLLVDRADAVAEALGVRLTPLDEWIRLQDWTTTQARSPA